MLIAADDLIAAKGERDAALAKLRPADWAGSRLGQAVGPNATRLDTPSPGYKLIGIFEPVKRSNDEC